MDNSEATSDYCAYCYRPNATVGVGEDEHNGQPLFVHQACESPYLRQVLGRNLVDLERRQEERAMRHNGSQPGGISCKSGK